VYNDLELLEIYNKIGNIKISGRKISKYFNEEIEMWPNLFFSFKRYYKNEYNVNIKKMIFPIKKILDYNTFKKNIKVEKSEIVLINMFFYRNNKKFSDYYEPIIPYINKSFVEISYIYFNLFFKKSTYNSFDYKKRFPLNSYILKEDIVDEEEKSKKINEIFEKIKELADKEEYLKDKKIIESLDYLFKYAYPESVRINNGYKRVLESFKPKLITTLDLNSLSSYNAICLAKKNNIKTLEIIHGMAGITFKNPVKIFPDKLCIFGKKDYKNLIKHEYPKEILEITGDVRNKKVKEMNKMNIDLKRKKLLFLTQGPAFTSKQTIKIIEPIFEWIKKNPEWNLTIKLHPDDRYYLLYWFYSLKYGIKTKIIKNTDLSKLIDNSDLIITKNSTAGIECVAKYKPILIEWIDSEKHFKLFNDYFDTEFYDVETLDKQIKKITSSNYFEKYKKQREKFLDDYSAGYGTAPEKIAKIIKKMLLE